MGRSLVLGLGLVLLSELESVPVITPDGFAWCEIQLQSLPNLQNIEIPDIDDIAAIKERCETKGGKEAYEKVKTAKTEFTTCIQGLVDPATLKDEVEEAKKTGSMDEVFGKYCKKRPKVKSCVTSLTDAIKPCLEDGEKQALNLTLDILRQLGDFACFRDGDRIAMFVAEDGVECIKDHTDGIQECVNKTLKISPTISTGSIPNLLIDAEKCNDLGKLQNCVVEELEKCKKSTPANIVDALFRFVKRSACPASTKSKRSPRIFEEGHAMLTGRSIHDSRQRSAEPDNHSSSLDDDRESLNITIDDLIMKRSTTVFNHMFSQAEARKKLITLFKEKCAANAPANDAYEILERSAEETMTCLKEKMRSRRAFVTPAIEIKGVLQGCATNLVEASTACLAPNEKYYPQFYLDVMYAVIDFMYANKAKLLSPQLNPEVVHCMQNFVQPNATEPLIKCLKDSGDFQDNTTSLDRQSVCGRLNSANQCVSAEINKRCIRDITVTQLLNDFAAAVTSPCNKKTIAKEDQ